MAEKTSTDLERWESQKRAIELKVSGLSVAEIATRLKLQDQTVRRYIKDGYAKITDILLLEGGALGEIVAQIDYVFSLTLGAFARAKRVVSVEVVQSDPAKPSERQPVETDDFYAKSQLAGKMTDLLRLKATVLGFTRADVNVLQQFNLGANTPGDASLEGIPQENVLKVREHLRAVKAIVANASVKTPLDVRHAHAAAGVKAPPAAADLLGVLDEAAND